MAHPWANVFILLVGGTSLVTGFLGLIGGSTDWTIALHVHRVSGYALAALLLWKGRNILMSLTNPAAWKQKPALMLGSIAIFTLLLAAMGLGIAWSYGGYFTYLGFSGVSWHIYLSLLLAPLVAWHTFTHSWTLRPRFWVQRRSFLRLAGLTVAGLALWRAGDFTADALELSADGQRFTGSYERGSFTGNAFPTTSWLNDSPDRVDGDSWRLSVSGSVDNDLSLDLEALAGRREKLTALLDCTGGWYSTQEWEGTPLREVLQAAGVKPGSRQHHRAVGYGIPAPLLPERSRRILVGHPRWWRAHLPRPRFSRAAGGSRQAGVRVGQVGAVYPRQRHRQVVAVALSAHVSPCRNRVYGRAVGGSMSVRRLYMLVDVGLHLRSDGQHSADKFIARRSAPLQLLETLFRVSGPTV